MTADDLANLPADRVPTRLAIAAVLLSGPRLTAGYSNDHAAVLWALSRADTLIEAHLATMAPELEPAVRLGMVRRVTHPCEVTGVVDPLANPPAGGVDLGQPLPGVERCTICGETAHSGAPTCGHAPVHLRLED